MSANTMTLMPGCEADCPCADCVIQQSDFAGAASSTVTGFTELLADWAIDGAGALNVTGPALIKGDTAHPDGAAGNQNVTVKFTGEGTGIIRAAGVVGLVDADNYLKGEVYIDDSDCDFLRLYKVSGGVATQLGDDQPIIGAVLGEEYDLQVCWQPATGSGGSAGAGTLRARISGGSLERAYGNQATTTSTGTYGGLAVAAGEVTFRQYRFKYMRDEVDKQNCPTCNTPCPISADDFQDATKSGCLWSGSFSVSAGKLNTTGRTKHLVFHPQLKSTMVASTSLLDGASIGPITMSINDDDAGSALEAVYETDANSRTLTIYRDGVELDTVTETGVTFPGTPVETTFETCFDGLALTATVAGLCLSEPTTEIPGGKWFALDGTATWDNVTLGKTKSAADPPDSCAYCGACPCAFCEGGEPSGAFLLTLGGVVDGTYECIAADRCNRSWGVTGSANSDQSLCCSFGDTSYYDFVTLWEPGDPDPDGECDPIIDNLNIVFRGGPFQIDDVGIKAWVVVHHANINDFQNVLFKHDWEEDELPVDCSNLNVRLLPSGPSMEDGCFDVGGLGATSEPDGYVDFTNAYIDVESA